jgi:subtilisin family serine protease
MVGPSFVRHVLALLATAALAGCSGEDPVGALPESATGALAGAAPASAGAVLAADAGPAVTDAKIVSFRRSQGTPAQFRRSVENAGGQVVFELPQIGVAVIRGLPAAELDALARSPEVLVIEDDDILPLPRPATPPTEAVAPVVDGGLPITEPFFPLQWNIRQVGADRVIEAGHTGAGARVVIIDSGIFYPHPDLGPNFRGGVNFFAPFCEFDEASLPSTCDPSDPLDDNGHGSHVAGIVAAAQNGVGVIGVAPKAGLYAAKACGRVIGCPTSSLIAGLVYAADIGADAVNLSIGGYLCLRDHTQAFPLCDPTINPRLSGRIFEAIQRAERYALRHDVLIVNSAGNDGVNLDRIPRSVKRIFGEGNNTVTVAALGPDAKAGHILGIVYTNSGDIVDLSAPGGSFVGAAEDFVPSAWSPLSTELPGALFAFALGTSMAAPHVTGAAALLVEEFGHGDPQEIRSRLQRNADLTGSGPSQHPVYGHGRLQVPTALGFTGGPY